jgi:hypothetical protein
MEKQEHHKQDQDFNERAKRTLTKLQQDGQKVQVLGRIKDGKIEIDQNNLKELADKYPNTNMVFVALNSPFDPIPCTGE